MDHTTISFLPYHKVPEKYRPNERKYAIIIEEIKTFDSCACISIGEYCIETTIKSRNRRDRMRIKGQQYQIRPLIYTWYYGKYPDKKRLRTTCGNNSCINPIHINTKNLSKK